MSEQSDVPDTGRADDRHTGAYVTSGVLLLLYGLVPAGWTAYTLIVRETPLGDFLLALLWPSGETHVMAMTPYEWAFAVALIVVGCFGLARRRVARGGALLFSVALLAVSLREAYGLLDTAYRTEYFQSEEGPWLLATRLFGLVVGVVVLTLMLRAKDERDLRPGPSLLVAAGAVMAAAGVLRLLALSVRPEGFVDYVTAVVDPTLTSPSSMFGSVIFYHATITVALLVAGVMAMQHLRVARGMALALLPVAAYTSLNLVVPILEYVSLDAMFDSVEGALYIGAELLTVVAAVAGLVLLAMAVRQRPEPPLDPAAFAPLPGDVGQQNPGGH